MVIRDGTRLGRGRGRRSVAVAAGVKVNIARLAVVRHIAIVAEGVHCYRLSTLQRNRSSPGLSNLLVTGLGLDW